MNKFHPYKTIEVAPSFFIELVELSIAALLQIIF
jgi:hypothetical protein